MIRQNIRNMNVLKDFVSGLGNAVTGGLLGTVGSLFGLGTSWAQQQLDIKGSKELMDYQFDLNRKFIEDQRAYDRPDAQMERLKLAGLNPNLVYGSGSVVGNTSSTGSVGLGRSPQSNLAKYQENAMMLETARAKQDLINSHKAGEQIDANIDNTNADTERTKAQTRNAENQDTWFWNTYEVRKLSLDLENQLTQGKINVASETAKRLIAQVNNDNRYTDAVINQIGETIQQKWKALELNEKELGARVKLWAQQGDAMLRQAKAALIQAMTGREMFKLKLEQWNTLGQEMKRRLQNINTGLERQNSWIDILNEAKTLLMGGQTDRLNRQTQNDDMSTSDRLLFQAIGGLLDFGSDVMSARVFGF